MDKEVEKVLKEIREEFFKLVREKMPEHLIMYQHLYEYALGPYPESIREYASLEILRTYAILTDPKLNKQTQRQTQ